MKKHTVHKQLFAMALQARRNDPRVNPETKIIAIEKFAAHIETDEATMAVYLDWLDEMDNQLFGSTDKADKRLFREVTNESNIQRGIIYQGQ